MIQVQRAYEAASQMVNNEHDRSLKAIDILTRTN
jgi:flagellar basal body rod protein FlgG